MDSVYIVMPAYNEEANIEKVVRQWYPNLIGKADNSRLVIADTGSTDQTHKILIKLQLEFPQLEILETKNSQHGPKLIALYDYAINQGANFIFQTDSDGQTNPEEFDKFWHLRKQYDAILGCRYVRGDGQIRAFIEHIVCFLLKIYFGINVPDANAPFRLMKSEIVQRYLYMLPSDYNLTNIMLTTYFSYFKENLTFREITFAARQGGSNSINIPKIIKIGWHALSDFRILKHNMQHIT